MMKKFKMMKKLANTFLAKNALKLSAGSELSNIPYL
jgi:hypothetical protein